MKPHLAPKYCCAVATLLAGAGLLSACGQYGDLYLPEKQPPSQTTDRQQDQDPQQTED